TGAVHDMPGLELAHATTAKIDRDLHFLADILITADTAGHDFQLAVRLQGFQRSANARRDAMTMDVPTHAQMAQELAALLLAPGVPDAGNGRACRIEHALPRNAL